MAEVSASGSNGGADDTFLIVPFDSSMGEKDHYDIGSSSSVVYQNLAYQNLQDQIVEIQKRLESLESALNTYHIEIYDLANEEYSLKSPVQIVIERYDADEFIARFPELDIFGPGETEPEAVLNLKNEIVDLYDELIALDEKELGRVPRMWLRILKKLILTNNHLNKEK
jgi:hypothetical protein